MRIGLHIEPDRFSVFFPVLVYVCHLTFDQGKDRLVTTLFRKLQCFDMIVQAFNAITGQPVPMAEKAIGHSLTDQVFIVFRLVE